MSCVCFLFQPNLCLSCEPCVGLLGLCCVVLCCVVLCCVVLCCVVLCCVVLCRVLLCCVVVPLVFMQMPTLNNMLSIH